MRTIDELMELTTLNSDYEVYETLEYEWLEPDVEAFKEDIWTVK